MNKISCVLITRDSIYPAKILESFRDGFFDEILIKTNSPSVYERYKLASNARNDVVFVMDDDCTLDYEYLFKRYDGTLTNAMTEHHFNAYKGSGCTLVGWGCFFPKSMLGVFDKYIERYGEDAHLLREADRIFTVLNQPHNTHIMEHHDFTAQTDRMWNEGNHWTSMAEAIEKAKALL